MRRAIPLLTAILMSVVGLLAFCVSFEAIRAYAVTTGAVSEAWSYAVPPLVDLPIVSGSLVWLNRSASGEDARAAKLVLVLAALASLALNVAHAPHSVGAWAVSLIAPASLVATVELAMTELRRAYRPARVPIGRTAVPRTPKTGKAPSTARK